MEFILILNVIVSTTINVYLKTRCEKSNVQEIRSLAATPADVVQQPVRQYHVVLMFLVVLLYTVKNNLIEFFFFIELSTSSSF